MPSAPSNAKTRMGYDILRWLIWIAVYMGIFKIVNNILIFAKIIPDGFMLLTGFIIGLFVFLIWGVGYILTWYISEIQDKDKREEEHRLQIKILQAKYKPVKSKRGK